MTAILEGGGFGSLRDLAARWSGGLVSRRFARELGETLDDIAACRRSGPDFLDARVYGGTVPELESLAAAQGMELWGEGARVLVESVGTIETTLSSRGKFTTWVRVRCLNYEEISQ